MVHVTRPPQGGLAIVVGAFGRTVWARRDPFCRRWTVWTSRIPKAFGCGDFDDGYGAPGVREPRRPPPGGLSGAVRLPPPDPH